MSSRQLNLMAGFGISSVRISLPVLVLVWNILVPMALAGAAELPAFSGDRAFEHLVAQCDLGPRPPGSEANAKLREMILTAARENGLEVQSLCFEAQDPMSGDSLQLCNVVVSAGPAGGSRLWIGAHFDTRPVSDHDPDPGKRSQPLLGANDGASGVAVLLHLMEVMGESPPPQGVDLLFFDGEDSGLSGDAGGFCLGSRRLAATCRDFGNPLARGTPRAVVVLDMVGKKNLRIPMEAYSLSYAPEWTREVFRRVEDLGLDGFVPEQGPAVYDDHMPFLAKGIPAVDLIDFDFPQWHTTADQPEMCSGESLGLVGRLMVDLIYNP